MILVCSYDNGTGIPVPHTIPYRYGSTTTSVSFDSIRAHRNINDNLGSKLSEVVVWLVVCGIPLS